MPPSPGLLSIARVAQVAGLLGSALYTLWKVIRHYMWLKEANVLTLREKSYVCPEEVWPFPTSGAVSLCTVYVCAGIEAKEFSIPNGRTIRVHLPHRAIIQVRHTRAHLQHGFNC